MSENRRPTITARLKEAQDKLGYTDEQMGKLIRMGPGTWRGSCLNQGKISLFNARTIATAADMKVDYILGLTDSQKDQGRRIAKFGFDHKTITKET